MENTKEKESISPILVIVLIGLTLNLVMALGMVENWISPKDFIWVTVIIYSLVLSFGALMSQVDTWLSCYEQNRYSAQLNRIQTDEILFEQVLKKELYLDFKRKYMNDPHRRATLIKMVAKLQSEFDAGIRAEAEALIEKEQKTRMESNISPVDTFLKKNNNLKTSTERAAEIFRNDNVDTKSFKNP
jgi:hypothetical protein